MKKKKEIQTLFSFQNSLVKAFVVIVVVVVFLRIWRLSMFVNDFSFHLKYKEKKRKAEEKTHDDRLFLLLKMKQKN